MRKKKRRNLIILLIVAIIAISGIGGLVYKRVSQQSQAEKVTTVRLGLVGTDSEPVWNVVKRKLQKEGIRLKYVVFDDYVQPDEALKNGQIDLHACLTKYYFESYNKSQHAHLVSIGNTVIEPLGLYSKKYNSLKQLPDGATIAIPNEPTTVGRALRLLQTAGLIKVKANTGIKPTLKDITSNPHHFNFKEVAPAQTPRALTSVDAAIINGNYAVSAGLKPKKDAIFLEPVNKNSKPYVNIIAAQAKNKDNKVLQKVVAAYQTAAVKQAIQKTYKGAQVAAWPSFGRK